MAYVRASSKGKPNFLKISNLDVDYKGPNPQGWARCQANISSLISYYNKLEFGQTLFPVATLVYATGQNGSAQAKWSYDASTGILTMDCVSNPRVVKVDLYYLDM